MYTPILAKGFPLLQRPLSVVDWTVKKKKKMVVAWLYVHDNAFKVLTRPAGDLRRQWIILICERNKSNPLRASRTHGACSNLLDAWYHKTDSVSWRVRAVSGATGGFCAALTRVKMLNLESLSDIHMTHRWTVTFRFPSEWGFDGSPP